MDIVGLGTIAMDIILEVDALPKEDGFAFVNKTHSLDGGSGANVVVQASRFGAECGYVAQLGDDEVGLKIQQGLKKEKVDISAMVINKNGTTLHTQIVVGEEGKKFILLNMGDSFLTLEKRAVDIDYILSADVFYTDLLPKEPAIYALKEAKKKGLHTVFNLQIGLPMMKQLGIEKEEILDVIKHVDVFAPCREAFFQLTGADNPIDGIKELRKYFDNIIVLTLGAEGSMVVSEEEILRIPAYKVDVKDTTGAGDAYIGTFMTAYFVKKLSLEEAAEYSSVCAAMTCTEIGARSGPTFEEVKRIMEKGI